MATELPPAERAESAATRRRTRGRCRSKLGTDTFCAFDGGGGAGRPGRAYDVRVARGTFTHRLLAPFAGLALTAALLGACAPAPGAAATVNGRVVGEDQVASVVEELSPYLQSPLTPSQAIQALVAAPAVIDVAAQADLGVSEEDARGTLAQLSGQTGAGSVDYSDATILVTRYLLATSLIQADPAAADLTAEATTAVSELDVTVSPRYGGWDGQVVTAPTYDWIVQPTADAA